MEQGELHLSELDVTIAGRTLLSLPQLTVPAGGLWGVSGPSGAGKTTFLNAISGLTDAKGKLCWGKADLCRLGTSARARFRSQHMGMIFQDFLLFEELSALQNATIGTAWRSAPGALRARALEVMERLGIADLAQRRTSTLSGGERQRVATARALAHRPKILLADEPTASLDRAAADRLIGDLVAMAREDGCTVIMVSHDERALAAMDHRLRLRDGKVEQNNE